MKRKLKIGILIDQLVAGGVQKTAIENVRTFNQLGHEAKLLVLMRRGYKKEFAPLVKSVPIEFLSDFYPKIFQPSIKFPIFAFFSSLHILSPFLAPMAIKKGEFDVIISHGSTTCFTAKAIKTRRKIPYVAILHDPMNYILEKVYSNSPLKPFFPILKPVLFALEKSLILDSVVTLTGSQVHIEFMKKNYKVTPQILGYGTKIVKKPNLNKSNYLLAFTRWEQGKNPQLLLELAKKFKTLKFKIAGSWTDEKVLDQFKRKIRAEKLSNRIDVLPFVTEKALAKLYSKALAFIHPNFEAFGLGGLEAAASGCPVIIPKGSGVTEILRDKIDGYFPKDTTMVEFAKPIQKLISDPKLSAKLGLNAWNLVKSGKYNWTNHTRRLLSLLIDHIPQQKQTIAALETGHASETYLSGGDKLLEKMAPAIPSNYELHVIVPKIGVGHWLGSRLKNISLEILPRNQFDNSSNSIRVFLAYIIRIWQSTIKLFKISPRIIYSSTNVMPDIIPAFLIKLIRPKTIWIARIHHLIPPPSKRPGPFIVNFVSYIMQAISLEATKINADLVIALNKSLYKSLTSQGFSLDKLKILGAGIDHEKINNSFTADKKFDAVFLGRLHPSKGVFDLLDIWDQVLAISPISKLAIIGGGPADIKSQLIQEIQKRNLARNIKVMGYLPEKKLWQTLSSSKIFLFTDYEAGWGIAIAEAMAAGLPVVGYKLDIFGDVFRKGYLTANLGNKEEFADKVISLLKNEGARKILAQKAILQSNEFSWPQTSQKFVNILNNLNG